MKIFKYLILPLLALTLLPQEMAAQQADRQFIRSGNRLYRQQNYAKAEIEYRKALGKNPNNAQAMYNLGCALMQQQKDSAAVAQFQNASRIETSKKRKSMAYHNIGVICQQHQLYGEAAEAYKESLRLNPTDDETRYNLALCLRQNKNQKKNQNDKQKQQKQKKKQQEQQNKDKEKQDKKQQQQQQQEQMSKENADQLLNYAVQAEKATQQRMKKAEQHTQRRQLEKNW